MTMSVVNLSACRPTSRCVKRLTVARHRGLSVQSASVFQLGRLLRILVPVAVLGIAVPSTASAATFRLASLAPEDSAWGRLIREAAREIKSATQDKVKFKLYLGGKLGDEAKVTKKMGRGLDGAFFTGQGVGLLMPAFRVQELPFLIESYEEADKVRKALWSDFETAFQEKTDYVLLGPGETGQIYLFSKKKIEDVAGLKQSKLWVWEGDSVALDTFKVFGVSPRPLDILTVVQQLKSGGINAVYNSPAGAVALGWTGDLAYVSGRNFAYAAGGFVLTKRAWKKIPEAHRATVKTIITQYSERMIQQARNDNQTALARLTKSGGGLQEIAISDAKYAEFKKVGTEAWPALAKNLDALPYLEKARKILGK